MRFSVAVTVCVAVLAASPAAWSNISKFDYQLGKLKKLSPRSFDGTRVLAPTMRHMAGVQAKMRTYNANLKLAIKYWNGAKPATRTPAKRAKLQAAQEYYRKLTAAFNARLAELKFRTPASTSA